MTAPDTTLQAVRAFARVWAPLGAALDEAARADRGFDGGEWSGPAHADAWMSSYEAALHRVAARYGLTALALGNAVQAHHHDEHCRHMGALGLPAWAG